MALNFMPFTETGLNDPNYAFDGVDRSNWAFDENGFNAHVEKFDKDGFKIARDRAMELARRRQVLAAIDAHETIINSDHPTSASYAIDGVQGASFAGFESDMVGRGWGT